MYPCKKCGECCKHIDVTPFAKELALANGVCKFLDLETNLCTQYRTRPNVCNIDKFYETFLSAYMSREEFYRQNIEICNLLWQKKRERVDEK